MEKNDKAYYYILLVMNLYKNSFLEQNDSYKYIKLSFVDEKEIDLSEINYDVLSNIFSNLPLKSFSLGHIYIIDRFPLQE
jgi:hypothetical protein